MARKKNAQTFTLDDLKKLSPKQLLVLIVVIVAAYLFGLNPMGEQSGEFIEGTVTRVVDGDTAVIRVDGQDRRVRLLGVDTPETVHPNKPVQFYGPEASAFTKDSLTGRRVWLEYDASPMDRYNRHLAYIWLSRPNDTSEASMRRDMFNARLLLGGYAKVMIIKPNGKYADEFRKFENEARSAHKGLWSQ